MSEITMEYSCFMTPLNPDCCTEKPRARVVMYGQGRLLCPGCFIKHQHVIDQVLGPVDPRSIPEHYLPIRLSFWMDKIDWDTVENPVKDCWPWDGAKSSGKTEYGNFNNGNRTVKAHQWAFQWFWGIEYPSLEDDEELLHECGDSMCANPYHLYKGDRSTNELQKHQHSTGNRAFTDEEARRVLKRNLKHGDGPARISADTKHTYSEVDNLLYKNIQCYDHIREQVEEELSC